MAEYANARAADPGAAAIDLGKEMAAEHNRNSEGRQAIPPAAGHLGNLLRAAKRDRPRVRKSCR
jgi:hypothetical protein